MFILPVPRIAKVEAQVMKTPGLKEHLRIKQLWVLSNFFSSDHTARSKF